MLDNWIRRHLTATFIIAGLFGFTCITYLTYNPIKGFSFLIVTFFLWLCCHKQRLSYAVALMAGYMVLSMPLLVFGWIDSSWLFLMLVITVLTILSLGVQRLTLTGTVVTVVIFWAGVAGLFIFQALTESDFLVLMLGGGASLIGWFIFHPRSVVDR